ncbi:hypothetical protein JW887_05265 [Candidatus Dojkabacteria bacterium]|nr:hypothetical protein [Candidatus Dojkabacteria bacterium]
MKIEITGSTNGIHEQSNPRQQASVIGSQAAAVCYSADGWRAILGENPT